jgi:hypothetical protein
MLLARYSYTTHSYFYMIRWANEDATCNFGSATMLFEIDAASVLELRRDDGHSKSLVIVQLGWLVGELVPLQGL